ncbi:MAG TPA: hypothetical protein VFI37_16970, partial [Gaiellaceae bacterium]|nr:hypothetical protein [Gaiellaceae bacterium]
MTLLALDVATLDWPHVLLRLGVAAALGGAIGVERELRDREAARGKQSGRTVEIQRLIGRALRSVADFQALGERTLHLDCDVL